MGFFNKRRGDNRLVKMGESANKRVLRLPVKQAEVISGIADELPIKKLGFARKARSNSFIKEKVKRLKLQALIKIILMRQIKHFLESFFHCLQIYFFPVTSIAINLIKLEIDFFAFP